MNLGHRIAKSLNIGDDVAGRYISSHLVIGALLDGIRREVLRVGDSEKNFGEDREA